MVVAEVFEPAMWSDLMTLLDEIEVNAGDEGKVRELCAARFTLAKSHGMDVVFSGAVSTERQ